MEVDMLGVFFQVTVVSGGIEVLCAVRYGSEGERPFDAAHTPTVPALVGQFDVGYVVMIAAVLRTGVVDILFGDGALPPCDSGR